MVFRGGSASYFPGSKEKPLAITVSDVNMATNAAFRGELVCSSLSRGDAIAEELTVFGNSNRSGERAEVGEPGGREIIVFLGVLAESIKSGKAVDLSIFRGLGKF